MAEAPAGAASLDPQAAIAKQAAITQSGTAGDAAIVARVESAIQHSPMGMLQGLLAETQSRAASEQTEVQGGVAKNQQLIAQNQKDAPKDAGPPPAPGKPAHPAVPSPQVSAGGGHAVGHKAEGSAAPAPTFAPMPHAPATAASSPATAPSAAPAPSIAAAVASAGGSDTQLDAMLNAYTPKGPQTTAMLGRIKQMGDVAQGFNGQLDVYVAQGGMVEQGIAKAANFMNMGKDVSAVWATNPYRKMHGVLGGIMTGLSSVKGIASVVGSIAGKLGLVLTVIGLLGMIFPPIGVAVEGVARVLNVIALICEAIGLVMSGILTGLNGVVLAQQIAAGSSAEEKAATADLMMSEANEAASGLINMAMVFGPKFMKGLMGNSRGIVASLMRRAKAAIGKISLKISANVSGLANKVVRKLGLGGAGMERVGGEWKDTGLLARTGDKFRGSAVGKAFYGAPQHLETIQDKLMSKYGNSKFAQGLDRVGAWSGSAARKMDIEEKVGGFAESAGSKIGGIGESSEFGRNMASAADRAERDTRQEAMRAEAQDAAHLEGERWRRELDRRQAANPDHIRNEGVEDQFIDGQKDKVVADREAGFESAEQKRAAKDKLEKVRDARYERVNDEYATNATNPATGKSFRDEYMDRVHDARAERWQLETQYHAQEEERKTLLASTTRSADENTKLAELNTQLGPLDEARRKSKMYDRDLSGVAGGGQGLRSPEYDHWGDVATNVKDSVMPMVDMAGWAGQGSSWKDADKYELSKATKWNKGDAKQNASGRAGHGTFKDIAADAQHDQVESLTEFVRQSPVTSGVGGQVRGMLSGISGKRPAASPQAANAPTANAPAVAQTPTTNAPTTNAPTKKPPIDDAPVANAAPTNAPAGGAPATPAPQHAESQLASVAATQFVAAEHPEAAKATLGGAAPAEADVAIDAAAGGAETLPYWPALLPEFDRATHDFGYMRTVAVEFRKVQIEGKQKAVDTLAIYGRYEEYFKLRNAAAQRNAAGAQQTGQNIQQNVSSSGASEAQGAEGEGKQQQAQGAAEDKAATDLPEPETHGFWGSVLGQTKLWAKNKAAEFFGWFQGIVASIVLKGLCGVSMGDLKDYAGALRHQQQAAHGVAEGAADSGKNGEAKTIKLGADANKEAQSAADSIGECDRNIVDADQFMNDLSSFELQLAEEKAFAQTFIAQLHAEVHAQQERQRRQAATEAASNAKVSGASAGAQPPSDGPTIGPAPAEPSAPSAAPTETPVGSEPHEDLHQTDPRAESEIAEVRAATNLVATDSDLLATQLATRADDYQNQLKVALTNRTGKDAAGVDLAGPSKRESAHIVTEFKQFATTTKQQMHGFDSMPIEPSHTRAIADTVINVAEHLDSNYAQSQWQLDDLFSRTYNGIRDGKHTLTDRVLGGNNLIGDANKAATADVDHATDVATPMVNSAYETAAAPARAAAGSVEHGLSAKPSPAPAAQQQPAIGPAVDAPLPATTVAAQQAAPGSGSAAAATGSGGAGSAGATSAATGGPAHSGTASNSAGSSGSSAGSSGGSASASSVASAGSGSAGAGTAGAGAGGSGAVAAPVVASSEPGKL